MSNTLASERADRIVKGDAEWRAQLTPEQHRIMRQHGTESPLNREKRAGYCINDAALTFKPGDP